MKKQYPELVKNLTSNPFPDTLEVTPNKAENVDKLFTARSSAARSHRASTRSRDGKQVSHRILQVAHVIEAVFTLATAVLLIASILLIANTIRLSIFSRRREIEVMKLVGATNWFVRGPFMLEGLFCGLAGSVLAVLFLVIGKALALPVDPAAPLGRLRRAGARLPARRADPDRHGPRARRDRLRPDDPPLPPRLSDAVPSRRRGRPSRQARRR